MLVIFESQSPSQQQSVDILVHTKVLIPFWKPLKQECEKRDLCYIKRLMYLKWYRRFHLIDDATDQNCITRPCCLLLSQVFHINLKHWWHKYVLLCTIVPTTIYQCNTVVHFSEIVQLLSKIQRQKNSILTRINCNKRNVKYVHYLMLCRFRPLF